MPAGQLRKTLSVGWALRAALLVLAGFSLPACGLGASSQKATGRPRVEPRDTRLVHELCPVTGAGARSEDINGDGKPDRRVANAPDGGGECRALDFDFDGVVDAWVYLDAAGQVRRREHDYDGDGDVDEVSLYRAGALVEQQRVTGRARKLDTWHYFEGGKMARTERDSNGDDYIDQWWEYPAERAPDCPLIHSDVDGDGQPDPGATVDICRDRYLGAPGADDAEAPPASGVDELPTEVEPGAAGDGATSGEPEPDAPAGQP